MKVLATLLIISLSTASLWAAPNASNRQTLESHTQNLRALVPLHSVRTQAKQALRKNLLQIKDPKFRAFLLDTFAEPQATLLVHQEPPESGVVYR